MGGRVVGRPTPSEKELVTRTSYSRVIEFQPLITQSSDHGTQHNLHSKHSSGSHLQYEIIRIIIECLIIALQSFFWVIVFNFPTIGWSPLLGLHSIDFLSLIFYCLEIYIDQSKHWLKIYFCGKIEERKSIEWNPKSGDQLIVGKLRTMTQKKLWRAIMRHSMIILIILRWRGDLEECLEYK